MISANEVRDYFKRVIVNKKEETKKFCDGTLSKLITTQAERGKTYIEFDIIKYNPFVDLLYIDSIYYNIPSVETMWYILLDAGYIIDITTHDNDDNITWTVRWDNGSNRELEGSL